MKDAAPRVSPTAVLEEAHLLFSDPLAFAKKPDRETCISNTKI